MGRKVHSWEITFASFQTVNCKIHNAEARKNGMEQTVEHHGSVNVQWRTTPASVAMIAHFSTVKKRSPSTFCNSRGNEFHIFRIPQSHKQVAFTWGTQEARKAPVLNEVPGAWRESKNMECLSNALITQHLPLGYHFILILGEVCGIWSSVKLWRKKEKGKLLELCCAMQQCLCTFLEETQVSWHLPSGCRTDSAAFAQEREVTRGKS